MTKEEQILLKHFEDLSDRAYYQNRPCFSDFLDMNSQSLLMNQFKGALKPELYGGFELAERKIACFSESPAEYPICWLEITPMHAKYAENLNHRDFLGSVLGLGLERNCIGDILIDGHTARLVCLERVRDFLISELSQVRHTNVSVKAFELPEAYAKPKFEVIQGTVSSIRLDSVIGLAYKLSRSQACVLIEAGQVYINSRLNTSNGANLKDGDIISVRHKGKFVLVDSKNKSKKNKCIIEVHKYV